MSCESSAVQINPELSDIQMEIKQLEADIRAANNPALHVPTESPNGNGINHLYSDGEITWQKGGWAYRQRSEFTFHGPVINRTNPFNLELVYKADYGRSYVMISEAKALEFRARMKAISDKM